MICKLARPMARRFSSSAITLFKALTRESTSPALIWAPGELGGIQDNQVVQWKSVRFSDLVPPTCDISRRRHEPIIVHGVGHVKDPCLRHAERSVVLAISAANRKKPVNKPVRDSQNAVAQPTPPARTCDTQRTVGTN